MRKERFYHKNKQKQYVLIIISHYIKFVKLNITQILSTKKKKTHKISQRENGLLFQDEHKKKYILLPLD